MATPGFLCISRSTTTGRLQSCQLSWRLFICLGYQTEWCLGYQTEWYQTEWDLTKAEKMSWWQSTCYSTNQHLTGPSLLDDQFITKGKWVYFELELSLKVTHVLQDSVVKLKSVHSFLEQLFLTLWPISVALTFELQTKISVATPHHTKADTSTKLNQWPSC